MDLRVLAYRLLRRTEHYTKTDMVYLASGGFWLVLEQITGVLFSLGLAIAFGHFASKDMYGNYKYILSLAGLLSALSLSGLGDAMARSVARGLDGALLQAFRMQLRWSFPFVVVTCAVSGYYHFIAENDFVAASLIIVALLQPLLASVSYFSGYFYARKQFMHGTIYSIIVNSVTFAALLSALFLGERAIMLVATFFIVKTLAAAYAFKRALQTARNDTADATLPGYGAHLSVMNVLGAVADKLDNVLIFSLLGPASLATYAFAVGLPEQLKGLLKNFFGLALPKLAEKSLEDLRTVLWPKIGMLFCLTSIVVGIYIWSAPLLFSLFFPLYMDAAAYSQWIAVSVIFSSIPPVLNAALTAHQKTRALYLTTNIPYVVSIASLALLVPNYGMWGAVAAIILSRIAYALVSAWQFMRA